ncbi:hypothetical protein LOD99_13247 [Oopsacas minuta]|uniref:ubiquitinyl hydrolase 1 n=1 Tax=Oopsacas minuta TaxID=111878 RepID=A0AAV7JBB5_9METZ|nr:hypothetical protein LOD99_13247 [Oopsacas minuta]
MPLIIPISRDSTTYSDLYRICIYFMQRYIDMDTDGNSPQNFLPYDLVKIDHVPEAFDVSEYPSDMFKIKLVNAYGSAEVGELRNDGKILKLYNRSIIALEWNSKYKSLYNERTLRDISSRVSLRSMIDLTQCIRNFLSNRSIATQLIDCTNCNQKEVSVRKELWILPDCLIIHLNRFEDKERNCTDVRYLFELDMNEFSYTKSSSSTQYYLYAVCNHYGSKEGGHYSASVKHTDGNWYCLDDSSVMRYLYKQAVLSNSACLLFYKRRS